MHVWFDFILIVSCSWRNHILLLMFVAVNCYYFWWSPWLIIYMCKLIIFANIWISNKIKPCVYYVAHHLSHYVIWLPLWSAYKLSKHPWGYFRTLIWLSGHEINCGSINSFRSQSKFSLPGPRLYQQTLLSVIHVWILFGSMTLLKPILNHHLRDLLQQYLVWSLQYFRFV